MVIQVCIGETCHVKGSYDIISILTRLIKEKELEKEIDVKACFCLEYCTEAVSVKFDEEIYSVSPISADQFFQDIVLKKEMK